MSRTIELFSVKKHSHVLLDYSNGQLFAVIGKNKSGKSTIMQCIEATTMISSTMSDPIKKGDKSGKVIRKGEDRDGNPITIEWEITEGENTFRAHLLDKKGESKIINDPKKIRDLIGTYFPLTVNDVFEMLKYAEGRQKFIKEYLYACLTSDQRVKIAELDRLISDKKNKSTEGNLFFTRAKLNKEIDDCNVLLRNVVINEAEQTEIDRIPAYEENLAVIRKLISDRNANEKEQTAIDNKIVELNGLSKSMAGFQDSCTDLLTEEDQGFIGSVFQWIQTLQLNWKNMADAYNERLKDSPEILSARETKGMEIIAAAKVLLVKKTQRIEALLKIEELEKSRQVIQKKLDQAKEERDSIIRNSNLPAGLSFDEETIVLNGFDFNESSVSETEARLAIMELLCTISTAQFVMIGDWSLYDKDSRSKILDLAKKNNRLFFGQLVTDDETIDCKVVIPD